MIDILKAKNEFKKYIKQYDIEDKKIKLKIGHMERVSNNSKKLAKSLNLEEEDIKLAQLIGLLHDIGRFEQAKRYNTFVDKDSINHGELGVKILFESNLIRKFIEDTNYDKIIEKSILNHNKSMNDIEEKDLSKRELLHTKIIRDADKTDIIYILTFDDKKAIWEKEDLSNDIISDEIYREFIECKKINYKERKTSADILVSHFAYVYDFNFIQGLENIKENNYLEKLYSRFKFKDKQTQKRYKEIYKISNQYIEEYINQKMK